MYARLSRLHTCPAGTRVRSREQHQWHQRLPVPMEGRPPWIEHPYFGRAGFGRLIDERIDKDAVWKRLRDCRQTDRFRTRPCFMPTIQVQCRCSGLEAEVCLRDRSCIHGDLGAITCSRHPPNYCFCRGLSVTLSQADKSSLQTMLGTVIVESDIWQIII